MNGNGNGMNRRIGGLQNWLETSAEGPVFLIAVTCMVARAAQFYSFGTIVLRNVLGPVGMVLFSEATGIGLAIACELLMSIAGRAWRADMREADEARGRRGLNKMERAALVKGFESSAKLQRGFMLLGLGASLAAAFSFLWTSSGDHNWLMMGADSAITLLLVGVVLYFGVFKDARREDIAAQAQQNALAIRQTITAAAGERIREGRGTTQDVRIVARALPRVERERFEAAMLPDNVDDPVWSVRRIAEWLGMDTDSGRRIVGRKLTLLMDKGYGILRDETQRNAYRVPQSVVLRLFADEFLSRRQAPSPAGNAMGTVSAFPRPLLATSPLADRERNGAGTEADSVAAVAVMRDGA